MRAEVYGKDEQDSIDLYDLKVSIENKTDGLLPVSLQKVAGCTQDMMMLIS
jgi:hypothetical protein